MAPFFREASRFWTGRSWWQAAALTATVLGFVGAQIAVAVAVNQWNRAFFDALERRSYSDVWSIVLWLPVLVILGACVAAGLIVSRMTLQVRWRESLSLSLVRQWISSQRYYRMQFAAPNLPAPEYRIAEDGRLAIEPLVEFVIGLITALVSAVTFAAILWHVAGSANFSLGGMPVEIPSYMALAAVLYAVATSWAAYLAGWPLVKRIAAKNEVEARFRAEMTRLRESSESIALSGGDANERDAATRSYRRIVTAWLVVVRQQGILSLVLGANATAFPVVPLLLIAPKYLAGSVTLGAVMQVVAAFMAVQAALIWFVDNFLKLAEWLASVARVVELQSALAATDRDRIGFEQERITLAAGHGTAITVNDLSVRLSNGRPIIAAASFSVEAGERVLITGETGSGKSTLLRALAGLTPYGSGTITFPVGKSVMFIPQAPYLPLGTLRGVLLYPNSDDPICDAVIAAALARAGLVAMTPRLDEVSAWDHVLSAGERQRLSFARLLLRKPDIAIMDEATSALDEAGQTTMLSLFDFELAGLTVISVGHRRTLNKFHDRKITLIKHELGARLAN